MNPQIAIAEAITARINAGTFSQAITAHRLWLPRYDTEELATLQIGVAPIGTIETEEISRTRVRYQYTTGVGLQQKIDPNDVETIDALSQLTLELEQWLRWTDPDTQRDRWTPTGYHPGELTTPLCPDAESLDAHKWLSVIFATFSYAP